MNESTALSQRIIVAVDFTPASEHALVAAIALAQRVPRTAIHVVHVLPVDPWIKTDGLPRESAAMEAASRKLRELVLEVGLRAPGRRWDQEVSFHVRLGDAVEAILQLAVDVDADLLVVGTHGRRGLERLLLGSVATRLVMEARLPVLVARSKELEGLPRSEVPALPLSGGERATTAALPRSDQRATLELGARAPHISGLV
jgi:nucleotide-binding universal stress UspA family protein